MISYTQFYLKEANLAYNQPLLDNIDQVLRQANVKKEPIRNWFKTHYVKWFLSDKDDPQKPTRPHTYNPDDPEELPWMAGKNIVVFTVFESDDIEEINELIRYFDSLEEIELAKIYKEPFGDQLLSKLTAWRGGQVEAASAPANIFKEGTDYQIITVNIPPGTLDENGEPIPKNTPLVDGRNKPMKWVKLLSKQAYECEGKTMGHCVKDYDPKTPNQDIISLWDKENRPHVTIEIKKKDITQIKGNSNLAPAERYQKPTIDYVRYLIDKKGMRVTGDGDNIKMNQYEGKFYFSDNPEWKTIYEEKIIPLQQSVFEAIKRRIVTVAGEGYSLVESYLTNLQKGFRYV